jgi:PAS domain-containing protein
MNRTQKVQHLKDLAFATLDYPHAGTCHGDAFKLLELLVIPTYVLDAHGRVIVWNGACARLTGVAARDVLGTRDAWRCFYRDERPTLADLGRARHPQCGKLV